MRDFIFINGPSGVGKTTLAKKLFQHYKSVYIEQNMIPEFLTIDGKTEMTGLLEEETCWTSMVALLKNFHGLGYKNILGLDFDDLRARDIPEVFKGYDYITLVLICSNYEQNLNQMLNREAGGLIDTELLEKMHNRILSRERLVNEYTIDISNKTPQQVFCEAVELIDNSKTLLNYDYEKPLKEKFYSWVFANGLR
jgi:GTPase SAR1 family protein